MSLKAMLEGTEVVTCSRETEAEEIAKLMESHDIGAVVVEDGHKPVGIVTDRDLVLRSLIHGERGLSKQAKDIMTKPVHTLPMDAGIHEVIELMNEQQVRRICVVDENERCAGIVSYGDIMELLVMELRKLGDGTAPSSEKLIKKRKAA